MNQKILLIAVLIIGFASCKSHDYETNLQKAKVLRITERLEVMITQSGYGYSEDKKLITDSITGCIQTQTVFDEHGRAARYYTGAAEGLVPHSRTARKGYIPFNVDDDYLKYLCVADTAENYIIDIAEPKSGRFEYPAEITLVTDTIRNFVIFSDKKIILSKDDYDLLQEAKNGSKDGKRYILYRYE